jgi:hypothetical protein
MREMFPKCPPSIDRLLPGMRARPMRRGFTVLESLMAAGILLVAVIAVSAAVTAGQHHAHEAQLRIAGTIAAEELMARLSTIPYENLMQDWNEFHEVPGEMRTQQDVIYPIAFNRIGRHVVIGETTHTLPSPSVTVVGLMVQVNAVDDRGETLVTLRRFIPEPQYLTIPDATSQEEIESSNLTRDLIESSTTLLSSDLGGLLDILD